MSDVGKEMMCWTITPRNNRVENYMVALSVMSWECVYYVTVHASLTIALVGL